MSAASTWRASSSRATRAVSVEMLDSRRLTRPNLLLDGPGAAMEVRLEADEREPLIELWTSSLQQMLQRLGWGERSTDRDCGHKRDRGGYGRDERRRAGLGRRCEP